MRYIVPRRQRDMLDFFRSHLTAWQQDPAALGLTVEQIQFLTQMLAEAEATDFAAKAARQRALTATQANEERMRALRRFGVSLMSTIRAKGSATDDEQVYIRASIPLPRPPSPTPPPEAPTNLLARPLPTGEISLVWDGTVAHGQIFQVLRAVDGSPFTQVAAGRFKKWTDARIPVGARQIQYRITAERGGRSAVNAASAIVTFGTVDGSEPVYRSRMAA